MPSVLRLSALRERLRTSLWLWPSVAVTLALVAGILLPLLQGADQPGGVGIVGTPEGARSILATVAGSMITVTGLTFSLTVVALQMASSQFTPRLLSTFLSDGGNQAVLSTFLATFAYSLVVLRSIRSPVDGGSGFVPDIAVLVGLLLALVAVGMLVFFFHHLTQQLRVESVLTEVVRDTVDLVRRQARDDGPAADDAPDVPPTAVALPALRTGYLQAVDLASLAARMGAAEVSVRLRPVVGTHLIAGTTIAWAWRSGGGGDGDLDVDDLVHRLHQAVHIGGERTLQQDVAFGLRQLVDIAARALSPGTNDPTTAVTAIHALGTVLAELAGTRGGGWGVATSDGHRVAVPRATFEELLALACDQPRRYGRTEPAVLAALLQVLTDLAEVSEDGAERAAVLDQIRATAEVAEGSALLDRDRDRILALADRARGAVARGGRSAEAPAPSRPSPSE